MATTAAEPSKSAFASPWIQLVIGIVCMVMIANYQYGWTLFVGPIDSKYHWGRASIQVAFTIFVLLETWLVPVEGWLVDRFGPRWVVVVGGVLCGIAWAINSIADSLPLLYFAAAIAGIGAGAVYGTCIGNAVKWFPGRRGLAAGLTAAGFGMGSALTIIPIAGMIKASGYEQTFLVFGLAQGIVVVVLGFFLFVPPVSIMNASTKVAPGAGRMHATWTDMIKTPVFWVMYVMFILMAAGGLMATAQLAPIAKDFKIADIPVSLIGITLPALTFALTIDRIMNGITRPFFGWVSDHIGRENTMFIAFLIEGLGIFALYNLGTDPVMFVILSGLVFFAWGEIYSLFPATVTDTYGSRYATTNTGLMYTAKGTASLLVPLANVLTTMTGNWHAVFLTAAIMNIVAAVMALVVLKPMRSAYTRRAETVAAQPRPAT
ncbi:MAG TPA: oxalate/formate MFS antiporter [Casimicrobiaceae bacterium]|jgi:OFA family oxalate/formate antiporter-like MFS transporter|nr:oxalate/formate MFS antiporter [Casimicrobiaceae bacterium]